MVWRSIMKVAFLNLCKRDRIVDIDRSLKAKFTAHCFRLLISCVNVYQFSGLALAQDPVRPPEAPPGKSDPLRPDASSTVYMASFEDYKIGPSDVIEIKIANAPELSGTYAVSATGAIQMSFLGALNIKDKTPPQLSKLIADKLRGEYLKDPQVTVTVTQYNSRSFYIQGEVRNPGV